MPSPITLDQYLDAICTTIGAVEGVCSCRSDGVLEETDGGPLVLLHPMTVDTLEEIGTTEWHAMMTLELVVLVARTSRTSRRAVMDLAMKVAKAARSQTWGLTMMPAQVTTLQRGNFDLQEPFGEAWELATVELTQEAVWWVGDAPPEPAVTTVMLGRAPDIGLGHEPDYDQVVPE